MDPLISIIIPVKNGERYPEPAIQGIRAQEMDVEIIVVDDALTDRTAEIAQRLGCTVLHHDTCRGHEDYLSRYSPNVAMAFLKRLKWEGDSLHGTHFRHHTGV